ncbi:shikimate kinase [Corynebacterium sp. CCM 8835]|uniref:Shikimate kinase n=1 Tax=Corynebacterium antarcticum TaxID=2800405 RepID=A0A9Q4GLV5_9CORY|nr:shikimate kinase [Corynebacterium antarcticum]MCK7641505.1 shikimate kinase [Corynebacterium antarcticum]MCK7660397.1 shikimate kinase [Corynebacterium antarcticum]MCL0244733.1 shikimate kinase [Corynebacterium antarcticum]MCX7491106.1 shikimate kinase [Corynebacterium antarcticum]MCX7537131.1 shikimate kinase [Corynebacterium antarcticum]
MSKPRVVLVGPPGAGKSTIGRRLASALNTTVIDTDQMMEQEQGKPCGDIYADLGEESFRELEARIVAEALDHNGVVSLGGGAVVTRSTRELLDQHEVIWLDVSAEEGVRRTAGGNRPVLDGDDALARYTELLDGRREFYREVASFRARTDERTPQQVVADVLGYLDSEV